ncbi:unnamed protein product [Durusdinium trenchii]|uniref:Uncharacterized protein n=1 Tax=Durusdinium trenchii TaxID=1381693 RepID=A0ABP0ICX1_9DINO
MAARTKFYILYWEGKDEEGINMNSLKPCRTCNKITNPYLFRLDNMQACLRSCAKEGELFREEVAEFWCVSPWSILCYNLPKFGAYLSQRKTKALTETTVIGTALAMHGAKEKAESGVTVDALGSKGPCDTWQSWLWWRVMEMKMQAQQQHQKCVVVHLDGGGVELMNIPVPDGNAQDQDIGSVIMVVGGPDGIKRPIMKDLSDILSKTAHSYLKIRLPGGRQHTHVVISDFFMAHDRGSLLYDLNQLLRLGQNGYDDLKEQVNSLWRVIAERKDPKQAVELLQKLKATAQEFKTQVEDAKPAEKSEKPAKPAKAESSSGNTKAWVPVEQGKNGQNPEASPTSRTSPKKNQKGGKKRAENRQQVKFIEVLFS